MSVAQADSDRTRAARANVRPYVERAPGRVATRSVDLMIIGLVVLAVLGVVGGLRAARASAPVGQTSGAESLPSAAGLMEVAVPAAVDGLAVGETAVLGKYTATVLAAGFQQTVGSQFVGKGYVVAGVEVVDPNRQALPYEASDWSLQTPSGQVVKPTAATPPTSSAGVRRDVGRVGTQVPFEVGDEKGDFYLLYSPGGGPDRQAWKVTL